MTKKWLPLTDEMAREKLTELWLSGEKYADVDLVRVIQGHSVEEMREVIYHAGRADGEKAKNVLESFCDDFLNANPCLIRWFIEEENEKNAEDESHLDDPRRGQAEDINNRRYLVAEAI